MVKDFYISSVYQAEEVIETQGVEAVLSIEHPGAVEGKGKAPIFNKVAQEIVCFWDTENAEIKQGPTIESVKQCLNFIENHKNKRVLIHCKAGKCRSVGVALGWLAKEYGIEKAICHVKEQSPKSAPNILVIEACDIIYGFNGALVDAVLQDADFTKRRYEIRSRLGDKHKGLDVERC